MVGVVNRRMFAAYGEKGFSTVEIPHTFIHGDHNFGNSCSITHYLRCVCSIFVVFGENKAVLL